MAFNLSDIGNMPIESFIQQGIDTFFKHQKEKTGEVGLGEIKLIRRSNDEDRKLYELPPSHLFTLGAYQVKHEEARGSVIVTLEHLPKLYESFNRKILSEASQGNLSNAEGYLHKQKNIDIAQYTHRLKVFRVDRSKILIWLMDLDLHDQVGSSSAAKSILESLLIKFLDAPELRRKANYLDSLVDIDWVRYLENAIYADALDKRLKYKLVFRKPHAPGRS